MFMVFKRLLTFNMARNFQTTNTIVFSKPINLNKSFRYLRSNF